MLKWVLAGSDAVHRRQLLIGPADVDANLGDTVVLECAAKKYTTTDVSDVTWTRDGRYMLLLLIMTRVVTVAWSVCVSVTFMHPA